MGPTTTRLDFDDISLSEPDSGSPGGELVNLVLDHDERSSGNDASVVEPTALDQGDQQICEWPSCNSGKLCSEHASNSALQIRLIATSIQCARGKSAIELTECAKRFTARG